MGANASYIIALSILAIFLLLTVLNFTELDYHTGAKASKYKIDFFRNSTGDGNLDNESRLKPSRMA